MNTKLIWATPNIDATIGYIARVSNPARQDNPDVGGLLRYMLREGHVSPFEMAHACIEVETTRDIGRQILRHRSFSFQEFSGRYQTYEALPDAPLREARMQDTVNRQNSLPCENFVVAEIWETMQQGVYDKATAQYRAALKLGIAKEQARALLPEGLTTTRMYMVGSMRSWIHYLQQRLDLSTQAEHRAIAEEVQQILTQAAPVTMGAIFA
jgi:thymidylate synthase (FAD)